MFKNDLSNGNNETKFTMKGKEKKIIPDEAAEHWRSERSAGREEAEYGWERCSCGVPSRTRSFLLLRYRTLQSESSPINYNIAVKIVKFASKIRGEKSDDLFIWFQIVKMNNVEDVIRVSFYNYCKIFNDLES